VHTLLVSPHFDDVPLSLGQSMIDGSLHDHRRTVGVVFGRTNWVRWFHPTRRRAPLAGAIRRIEEAHAALRFGYRLRIGRREEALLRLGTADPAVFLDPHLDVTTDPELEGVTSTLAAWAGDAGVVLVPLGIGDHVDHRLVAEAGRRLAAGGHPVGFYEDRPYVSFASEDEVARRAAGLELDLGAVEVSGPIGRTKQRRIRYPSQIDDFFTEAFDRDLRGGRTERVWFPAGADLLA
jgi:hypothetical protein